MQRPKLGLIGGSGFYAIEGFEVLERRRIDTPFGAPSDEIVIGRFARAARDAAPVAFLPRHGRGHALLPGEINYRANIFALKSVGCEWLVSVSAVGSLREELRPGDFVLPSQWIDFTRGPRERSFFGRGVVAHVSTARPASAPLCEAIAACARARADRLHAGKTYVCVEGPRLGTRAESLFFRRNDCDIVGMTNVPEVFLAREAQMAYATIAVVTDYDCWLEDPAAHVSAAEVFRLYKENLGRVQALVAQLASQPLPPPDPVCRQALQGALVTPRESLSEAQRASLDVLLA